MSNFRRTASGLNNQFLFYNVDIVLYLEGGNSSFNKEEVIDQNKFHDETLDIIFWEKIFEEFLPNKKIKYKSVGSKKTVKEIAEDIVNRDIKTVFIAMDNEFDEILNLRINHPQIFYAYGYSWENDAWNERVIKSIIEELSVRPIQHNHIETIFSKSINEIKYAVYADAYLFSKSNSFFPRTKGRMFCVNCTPVYLPEIKKVDIENRLTEKGLKKTTIYSFAKRKNINNNIKKYCFGHFLADYCCQIVRNYLKNKHALTVDSCIIHRMGINKYFQTSFKNSEEYSYYERLFGRLAA